MASKKWITLPGGRIKRWKKSGSEHRPGWRLGRASSEWCNLVWWRPIRRTVKHALRSGRWDHEYLNRQHRHCENYNWW